MHGCGDVSQAPGRRPGRENVGVLLRGTKREEVERGQVLTVPGAITPHKVFEAEVQVLKDEGAAIRHSSKAIVRSFISVRLMSQELASCPTA